MKRIFRARRYTYLIRDIGFLLEQGRRQAFAAVNQVLVKTYWEIGRQIVEYEQGGKGRAKYGAALLIQLSKDLSKRYGTGFSRSNLTYMRLFYLTYPKCETVSHTLAWSHVVELLKIDNDVERGFYEKESVIEHWSIRELKRQKNSALFYRIALCKDKKKMMRLAREGNTIESAEDVVRDPYILEFLRMKTHAYSEKELEQNIIDNLQMFLLELGRGFTFIGRQYRITLDNTHYFIDLVFYHRIIKCFVLIDLKVGTVTPQDVGQMNAYLNYFKTEEMAEGDNEPVGIILGTEKDKVIIEYALGGISNKLFVSKYKLYLPDKKELACKLKSLLGPNY
ncbi:MAG: PDDEXK nuclease domain-containing protein [Nanoarchaeota archaeon]